MTDPGSVPAPIGPKRDATIARLCEHFAADHLEAEELERRIDMAHKATTLAELSALLDGLPSPATGASPAKVAVASADSVAQHQSVVAILGGTERRGAWMPARQIDVVSFMGGTLLDFREAILPPGTTEIRIAAIMGGVEVVVPPGLSVTSDGIGIMGGFAHSGAGSAPNASPGGPTLRISGFALMGGVEISVREAGETAGDAHRRQRLEAREKRRELRARSRSERRR